MTIIFEPSVYLVTRQAVINEELNRFLVDHNFEWDYTSREKPGELAIEVAGRLCYLSYGTGRSDVPAYFKNILDSHHGSVIEHAVWGFIFTGISRSLTHELVRHRAGTSYSQLSQRYVNEADANFVVPPAIIGHDDELSLWIQEVEADRNNYIARVERMLKWPQFQAIENRTERRKAVREAARSTLPNATETMIFVTGNARAWRNMLELRLSSHAELEIRRLQMKVYERLLEESPNVFGDYRKILLPDGTFEVTTENLKV